MLEPEFSQTDQCVMCGMCLPHCPTYTLSQTEAESPRGRISMIQGVAQGKLSVDQSLITHLYNCTGCGACEAMCPSKVPFMALMDQVKTRIHKKPLFIRILLHLVKNSQFSVLNHLIRQRALIRLLAGVKLISAESVKISRFIQNRPKPASNNQLAQVDHLSSTNIALFTGCISSQFDQQTLDDTRILLGHFGYNVAIPEHQACCGALHQHNGDPDTANTLAKKNQHTFKDAAAIISTSTGCSAQLKQTDSLDSPVFDILEFIQQHQLLDKLSFTHDSARLLIHEPCTARNALNIKGITETICSQIPSIEIMKLAKTSCCGAGGMQFISQPETPQKLLSQLLDTDNLNKATVLLTSNIGCALHIGSELMQRNRPIEIMHPVSFIVKQAGLK